MKRGLRDICTLKQDFPKHKSIVGSSEIDKRQKDSKKEVALRSSSRPAESVTSKAISSGRFVIAIGYAGSSSARSQPSMAH